MFELALNQERALVWIIRQLQVQSGGRRIGKDQRFANLKVFDDEWASIKQLHTRFEHHFHKRGRGKYDQVLYPVILQKDHMSIIELRDPRRGRPWQPDVEKSAAPGPSTACVPVAGLMPPPALVPRVGWQ